MTHVLRWLKPNYPYYFFDSKDLPVQYLQLASELPGLETYHLVVGTRTAEHAVTKHLDGDLAGLVQITFSAADAWFEEDEEIFVHPKDPYKVCTTPTAIERCFLTAAMAQARGCAAVFSARTCRGERRRDCEHHQAALALRDEPPCPDVHT